MVRPRPQQGLGSAEVVSLTPQHIPGALLERNRSSKDIIIYCTGVLLAKVGCKTPQAVLKLEEQGESLPC